MPFHLSRLTAKHHSQPSDPKSSSESNDIPAHLRPLLFQIKDYQLTHGSLLKIIATEKPHTVLTHPVGCTVYPTPFPSDLFHQALKLQNAYNKLYAAAACDEKWLHETLQDFIDIDMFANSLWGIYEKIKAEGGYIQPLSLGIWRNDYMLHASEEELGLKQVEFNTFSCAGGVHGNKVADMHRHLARTGVYETSRPPYASAGGIDTISYSNLPVNNTIEVLVKGLKTAHEAYGSGRARETCVLIIVQPQNFNIADERPLEYGLWDSAPPIPIYRVIWGEEVVNSTSLTQSRELLYHPPAWDNERPAMEVSVVYMRAGYEAEEYDAVGIATRLRLESSRAIKAPSLLSHLTTFKKVQQALAMPDALSHFKYVLTPEEINTIEKTFVPLYPIGKSETGKKARKLANDASTAIDYILKPSLEGGGHNVYGKDIPRFLKKCKSVELPKFVLMEKIRSPGGMTNVLKSPRGIYEGEVVSELGIFGVCLFKNGDVGDSGGGTEMQELGTGWSFKTKDKDVDEMSVVKGYGCFDSPLLVGREVFLKS